jgi:DNA-binding phage protein
MRALRRARLLRTVAALRASAIGTVAGLWQAQMSPAQLSEKGDPRWRTLAAILRAFGVRLRFAA